MIGPLGLPELLVIGAILFLFFGAKKLPDLARGLGSAVREFRQTQKELRIDELHEVRTKLEKTIDVGASAKEKILGEVKQAAKSMIEPAKKPLN